MRDIVIHPSGVGVYGGFLLMELCARECRIRLWSASVGTLQEIWLPQPYWRVADSSLAASAPWSSVFCWQSVVHVTVTKRVDLVAVAGSMEELKERAGQFFSALHLPHEDPDPEQVVISAPSNFQHVYRTRSLPETPRHRT